jgi:hypothetical protein
MSWSAFTKVTAAFPGASTQRFALEFQHRSKGKMFSVLNVC